MTTWTPRTFQKLGPVLDIPFEQVTPWVLRLTKRVGASSRSTHQIRLWVAQPTNTVTDAAAYDPSSVEWIDERPWTTLLGNGYLTNYSTQAITLDELVADDDAPHQCHMGEPMDRCLQRATEWWIMMTVTASRTLRTANTELSQTLEPTPTVT